MKKHKRAIPQVPLTWRLTEQVAEERFCVGDIPVLYVRGVYPVLIREDAPDGGILTATEEVAHRFNDGYQQAVEAFVYRGLDIAGPRIMASYAAMGAEAAHRFQRREWRCTMTAVVLDGDALGEAPVNPAQKEDMACLLHVKIQKSFGLRRKGHGDIHSVCEHWWQFPQGVLLNCESKYKDISKKVAKNY